MTSSTPELQVQDLNHYGIIAGIIDQIDLVEQTNQIVEVHHQQMVTLGQSSILQWESHRTLAYIVT